MQDFGGRIFTINTAVQALKNTEINNAFPWAKKKKHRSSRACQQGNTSSVGTWYVGTPTHKTGTFLFYFFSSRLLVYEVLYLPFSLPPSHNSNLGSQSFRPFFPRRLASAIRPTIKYYRTRNQKTKHVFPSSF